MLCMTFDNFGRGADFGHGQGKLPPCLFPDQVPAAEWDRYNEFAITLGHPRILQLLSQLGVRTTFFAEGYAAEIHPDEMKQWSDGGHEIALHGWKHEMWSTIEDPVHEDELISMASGAVEKVTGRKPVGFRPSGLKIGPNTDVILTRHGIRYVSQVSQRTAEHAAMLEKAGETAKEAQIATSLPLLPCSDEMTDVFRIDPAHGGIFGSTDDIAAYDRLYEEAFAHESVRPSEPWVFIAHPFCSGNRGWHGFARFMRRLTAEFGPGAFKTGAEVTLGG